MRDIQSQIEIENPVGLVNEDRRAYSSRRTEIGVGAADVCDGGDLVVGIRAGADTDIMTKGRHDPCVGIRAVPVGEAMMACVLADHLLRQRAIEG